MLADGRLVSQRGDAQTIMGGMVDKGRLDTKVTVITENKLCPREDVA